MDTSRLIRTLAADNRTPMPMRRAWLAAVALAIVVAAAVFFITIGPRADFAEAAETVRFLFKFVLTLVLAASALLAVSTLAQPGADTRWGWLLAVAPFLAALAVALELSVVSSDEVAGLWLGKNWLVCLTWIPLIGVGPLAAFLAVLRHGAPTRPGIAGAVAGLAAGGLAATFYAAHCTDDSPLFVSTWYTIAITALAVAGAAGGRLFARW